MADEQSPVDLERIAVASAEAAAELVRSGYGRARRIGTKSSPTDVFTQTDLDAEHLISTLLHGATPHAGFLGEEGGATTTGTRLQWIVDPLDGTVNFLYGVPVFAVSIAAAMDGEVVAGAVVDVLRNETYGAHLGGGARCGAATLAVSECDDLTNALVATGFAYGAELRHRQGEIVHRLLSRARDVRCFGSAALELCWVACGRLDGYYERDTKLWDYAAGALIASEAGALTEMPCPENDDLMVASTPNVFSQLRAVVQQPVT